MTPEWYFHRGGKTQGPVSGERLQQLSASGNLAPDDLVWRDGMSDWMPARSLGLLGARSKGPPTPPPPPPPPPAKIAKRVARRARSTAAPANSPGMIWMVILLLFAVGGIGAGWYAHSLAFSKPATHGQLRKTDFDNSRFHRQNRNASAMADVDETDETYVKEEETSDEFIAGDSKVIEREPIRPLIITRGKSSNAESKSNGDASPRPENDGGSDKPLTLYQDIDVQQDSKMSIGGIPMEQKLHYRVISRLLIEFNNETHAQTMRQEVIAAELEAADEASRAEYEKSLRELKGQVLTFQVAEDGRITDFKGYKDTLSATRLDRSESAGYVVTSLLDEDGWKELTRLTFFRPKTPSAGSDPSWKDQMTHDWGPLGKWVGLTTFRPSGGTDESLRQYEYMHEMRYEPPAADSGGLPFALKDAAFEPVEAAGVIHYDSRKQQVSDVQERFHVRGTINTEIKTELLDQAATIELEEIQLLTIRLMDQMPQSPR